MAGISMPEIPDLEFRKHRVFRRDLKRLLKKYRSLEDDMEIFQSVLRVVHEKGELQPEDIGCFPFAGLGSGVEGVFIAKRFACRALKGSGSRSGIRIVYRFHRDDLAIELLTMFHKSEKSREDPDRITGIISR
jgi:hypothetical protein